MADSTRKPKAEQSDEAAEQEVREQAAPQSASAKDDAAANAAGRRNEAAARSPELDRDLEEVRKADDDPTSQRASSYVHGLTTEYAGYVNSGRPERAGQVEAELARLGYSTDGIRLADSPSLPQHVAEAENARTPAERRKEAARRKAFAEVTGRRAPSPTTAEGNPLR